MTVLLSRLDTESNSSLTKAKGSMICWPLIHPCGNGRFDYDNQVGFAGCSHIVYGLLGCACLCYTFLIDQTLGSWNWLSKPKLEIHRKLASAASPCLPEVMSLASQDNFRSLQKYAPRCCALHQAALYCCKDWPGDTASPLRCLAGVIANSWCCKL